MTSSTSKSTPLLRLSDSHKRNRFRYTLKWFLSGSVLARQLFKAWEFMTWIKSLYISGNLTHMRLFYIKLSFWQPCFTSQTNRLHNRCKSFTQMKALLKLCMSKLQVWIYHWSYLLNVSSITSSACVKFSGLV